MITDKFEAAEKALKNFEKMYGSEVQKAFSIANGYISRELTDGMVAGIPQQVKLDEKKLWVIPIVLAKKTGVYAEIGAILLDADSLELIGASDKSEILNKAELLLDENAEE